MLALLDALCYTYDVYPAVVFKDVQPVETLTDVLPGEVVHHVVLGIQ